MRMAASISSQLEYIAESARAIDVKMSKVQENDWAMLDALEKSVHACKTTVTEPLM